MRLLKSFIYAFRGLRFAIKGQPNFLIHTFFGLAAIVAAAFFRVTRGEWLAIVLAIGLVFSMELINTAIEKLINFIHPGWSRKVGKIKDIAAAAVLISAITALIIGLIIFIPYLFSL